MRRGPQLWRRRGRHAGARAGGGTIGDVLAGLLAGDEQPVVDQGGDGADHSGCVGIAFQR
jgi:hypothetical protein